MQNIAFEMIEAKNLLWQSKFKRKFWGFFQNFFSQKVDPYNSKLKSVPTFAKVIS